MAKRLLEASFEGAASRRRLRLRDLLGESGRRCAAALFLVCLGHAAEAVPRRVVSLNLCADELVLRLADRSQVAAVTWLARDPRGSTVAEAAAGVPVTRGLSEEILALEPDLVIAGAFTTRMTVGMLERIGLPVMELGLPANFEGVRRQIRQVASAVGHPERGEAMVADLDARLAAVRAPGGPRPRALVMRPNAFTVAPGSLGDAILTAAGFANAGAEIGQDRTGAVPLEAAALADPDLIVLDEATTGTPSLADTLLHHPVLQAFVREGRSVTIPNRLWTCPGPQVAEVVERLAAAAAPPPPSAGEGGPRVSEGRERGKPSQDEAVPAPLPPAPQAPSPAEGGGFARKGPP